MTSASPLEHALLGLLQQKTQSGYDLRKTFSTTPIRHYSDSPGSIYPALRRIEARGWIRGGQEEAGRKRQVFRITADGERALKTWLRQPVSRDDIILRLDELMLRFAFHTGNVPRSATLTFLQQMERESAAYVRELREFAKVSGLDRQSSTGALAFANGIQGYDAHLQWVRWARKKFMEEKS